MSNSQAAHVWAQMTRDAAGNWSAAYGDKAVTEGSGYGAIRFVGPNLYSYRTRIASILERGGTRFAVFSGRTYSTTTAKHLRYARRAADHLPGVTLDSFLTLAGNGLLPQAQGALDPEVLWLAASRDLTTQLTAAADTARRARSRKRWRLEDVSRIASEARAFAEFLGQDGSAFRLNDELAAEIDRLTREQAEQEAKEAAELAAQNAIELAGLTPTALAWKRGEVTILPQRWHSCGGATMLRRNDDLIQTSRGADFPLEHAVKAWPILQRIRTAGEAWRRNGHSIRLGHFQIDNVAQDGTVRAGCHTLEWSEIARLAAELGLPATESEAA